MLPVPDLLQRGFVFQLRVEKPVLINKLFFLELGAVSHFIEFLLVLRL